MANYLAQIPNILWWLFVIYAVVISVFTVLENRSPQSTFAWLLLFFSVPVVGPIIYFMFGRDYKAFSRHNKLLRQQLGKTVWHLPGIHHMIDYQTAEIERLKQAGPPVYGRLLELIRRNIQSPLFINNQLEILQNGQEKYPRLMEDLKTAQHSIHMEYFEWASDPLMQEFKQILLERAAAGVQIRLIYDPLGCFFMLDQSYINEMNAGGIKMIPYSPIYRFHTISYRSHRKIVVIDGKIGYIGGLNMAEIYLKGPGDGNFTGWRDIHTRVVGEVVWGLQYSFIVQWYNTTQEQLVDPAYFPALTETYRYLPLQVVNSGPDAKWKAIRQLYFAMITAAEHHVYIQSPFFILDDSLAEALSGAARAGVDVKVMLAPGGPGEPFTYRAGYTYAQDMAEAGVRIFFYQGHYFHAKTISVDSQLCSVGSANMDIRSFTINYESNLIVYDAGITQQLEQTFLNDLRQCREFDLHAYKTSPIWGRMYDSVSRLGSPLL